MGQSPWPCLFHRTALGAVLGHGRGAGDAVAATPEVFEAAKHGAVEGRRRGGIRGKGSVRDGLNGAVEPGFSAGSRFKGSIRDGLNGVVGAGFAVGSRFKGLIPGSATATSSRGAVAR
jgi:hypothetical protein